MTTRGRIHDVRVLPWHIAPLTQHMIEKIPPDLSKFLICPMPGLLVTHNVGAGDAVEAGQPLATVRSEEHTSELQSLMSKPYAVICLNKNTQNNDPMTNHSHQTH